METSIGSLYVHNLTARVAIKLSKIIDKLDLEAAGNKALQFLLSKDSDKSSRAPLGDSEYASLSRADFEIILPVAFKQCDFSAPDEVMNISNFGAAVQAVLKDMSESSERISKRFRSVLSPGTLSRYSAGLEGVSNITEKIRQTIAPKNAGFGTSESVSRVDNCKPPPRFDFSAMPENRAAKATEKSAETLEKMSALLLEMAASVGTLADDFMRNVVPEYFASLDESRVRAIRTLQWTVFGLVISACVAIGVASAQAYLSNKSGKESARQAKETLEALHQQLEAAKGIEDRLMREFAMQRQQNQELNTRLIEAIKKMPAPIVKVVKISVPEVKLVK